MVDINCSKHQLNKEAKQLAAKCVDITIGTTFFAVAPLTKNASWWTLLNTCDFLPTRFGALAIAERGLPQKETDRSHTPLAELSCIESQVAASGSK